MQKELEGVPIELINEALVSRLPQEIRIAEAFWDGSLWTTDEDRREVEDACRKRYRSYSRRFELTVQDELAAKKKWAEIEHKAAWFEKIEQLLEKRKMNGNGCDDA